MIAVEIAAQQAHQLPGLGTARFGRSRRCIPVDADLGARARRFFLAQLPQQLVERLFLPLLGLERLQSGQQLIENDPQRVHVGARVDVLYTGIGLLWTHVSGRSHEVSQLRKQGLVRQPPAWSPWPARSR